MAKETTKKCEDAEEKLLSALFEMIKELKKDFACDPYRKIVRDVQDDKKIPPGDWESEIERRVKKEIEKGAGALQKWTTKATVEDDRKRSEIDRIVRTLRQDIPDECTDSLEQVKLTFSNPHLADMVAEEQRTRDRRNNSLPETRVAYDAACASLLVGRRILANL